MLPASPTLKTAEIFKAQVACTRNPRPLIHHQNPGKEILLSPRPHSDQCATGGDNLIAFDKQICTELAEASDGSGSTRSERTAAPRWNGIANPSVSASGS